MGVSNNGWIDDLSATYNNAKLKQLTSDAQLKNMREALVKEFNTKLGESIPKNDATWKKVIAEVSNGSSKGSIGESFAQIHKIGIDAGATSHTKFSLSQTISDKLGLLKNREADNFWIYANNDKLIIVDVKVGSSFDNAQLIDYGKIMDALVQFKSEKGKALSQFLESKNIPTSALDNVEFRYIVLDGGNGDVATQAAKIQKAVEKTERISDETKDIIKVVTEW